MIGPKAVRPSRALHPGALLLAWSVAQASAQPASHPPWEPVACQTWHGLLVERLVTDLRAGLVWEELAEDIVTEIGRVEGVCGRPGDMRPIDVYRALVDLLAELER